MCKIGFFTYIYISPCPQYPAWCSTQGDIGEVSVAHPGSTLSSMVPWNVFPWILLCSYTLGPVWSSCREPGIRGEVIDFMPRMKVPSRKVHPKSWDENLALRWTSRQTSGKT